MEASTNVQQGPKKFRKNALPVSGEHDAMLKD